MNKTIYSFVLMVVLLFGGNVFAKHPSGAPPAGGWNPDVGLTLGGSLGYVRNMGSKHGFVPGLEATIFKKIKRPFFLWGTLGGRGKVGQGVNGFIPYAELGLNVMLLNIGMGYGYGSGVLPDNQLNIFTGLSVPLFPKGRQQLFFAQFYYRPIFFLGSDFDPAHEVGLMFKFMLIFKRDKK